MQAPAYGHGKKGREGIDGVGKVRRGYIVKFPHPMYTACIQIAHPPKEKGKITKQRSIKHYT